MSRVSKVNFYNCFCNIPDLWHQSSPRSRLAFPQQFARLTSFSYSSVTGGDGDRDDGQTPSGSSVARATLGRSSLSASLNDGDGECDYYGRRDGDNEKMYHVRSSTGPQQKLPERPRQEGFSRSKFDLGKYGSTVDGHTRNAVNIDSANNKAKPNSSTAINPFLLGHNKDNEKVGRNFSPQMDKQPDVDGFLEKLKLGFDRGTKKPPVSSRNGGEDGLKATTSAAVTATPEPPQPAPRPQDVDEIFKKMKETGLIPNAVAMLHGLCSDGLVQEAMKLFSLMREKGTIPEVVIYTAVVEGFCKAQKLEDAKRIFKKMQNSGVSPNAFSYGVLIQGLCEGKSWDDALEFCSEMLDAGHSPNLATFTSLVDGFCKERGLEAAKLMIATLRRKGFFIDEKSMREFLEKKGPFMQLVWKAILEKNGMQGGF